VIHPHWGWVTKLNSDAFDIFVGAMRGRPYQPQDNPVLARLFTGAVMGVSTADYSQEQIEAWASSPPDVSHWCGDVESRFAFVAEHDSEIVGFATAEPNGHLDHLYVHHQFQRRGIASALLQGVEQELVSRGLDRIFTEASISARAFFEQTQCWFLVNLAPRGELLSVLSATRKLTMLRRFPVSPSSSDGVPYCCGSSISLGQSAMSGFIAGIRYTPSLWIAAPFCTQSAR
jgi:GNAT superfamily N-acetyltransferase